jgi:threonine dehydratase
MRTADRRPSFQDVLEAREEQHGRVLHTPLLSDPRLDRVMGRAVHVKAEFLQRAGSFKFRGIDHSIRKLSLEERARGVVIVSSGNAAQAAALSAHLYGVPCTVVASDFASETKLRAAEALGASIVRAGTTAAQVFGRCTELAESQGLTTLHPFDRAEVIAGHGSLAMEILEDLPEVGTIVVPTGGGGLLAAVAIVAKTLAPAVRVIGVEPSLSPAMRRSLDVGSITALDEVAISIADGLISDRPGDLTYSIAAELVDDVVLVGEEAIAEAMAMAYRELRVAIEPSSATALAALLEHRWPGGAEVAVATGGNFDPALLAHVVSGRTAAAWRERAAS